MKKNWLPILMTLSLFSFEAKAQEWVRLGGTSYLEYLIQHTSLRFGKESAQATLQTINKVTGRVAYTNYSLPLTGCTRQQGKILILNLSGSPLRNYDYALGGSDINSIVASYICESYRLTKERDQTVKDEPKEIIQRIPVETPPEPKPVEKIEPKKEPESVWQRIAQNDDSDISLKIDSFSIIKVNKEPAIKVVGKNIDRKTGKTMLLNWVVKKEECAKEQGKLTTSEINSQQSYDNNFIFGSGTIGSIIAEAVCVYKGK